MIPKVLIVDLMILYFTTYVWVIYLFLQNSICNVLISNMKVIPSPVPRSYPYTQWFQVRSEHSQTNIPQCGPTWNHLSLCNVILVCLTWKLWFKCGMSPYRIMCLNTWVLPSDTVWVGNGSFWSWGKWLRGRGQVLRFYSSAPLLAHSLIPDC